LLPDLVADAGILGAAIRTGALQAIATFYFT